MSFATNTDNVLTVDECGWDTWVPHCFCIILGGFCFGQRTRTRNAPSQKKEICRATGVAARECNQAMCWLLRASKQTAQLFPFQKKIVLFSKLRPAPIFLNFFFAHFRLLWFLLTRQSFRTHLREVGCTLHTAQGIHSQELLYYYNSPSPERHPSVPPFRRSTFVAFSKRSRRVLSGQIEKVQNRPFWRFCGHQKLAI